jgi:hypothetical protein
MFHMTSACGVRASIPRRTTRSVTGTGFATAPSRSRKPARRSRTVRCNAVGFGARASRIITSRSNSSSAEAPRWPHNTPTSAPNAPRRCERLRA